MFCYADCENLTSWYDAEKWEEYETIAAIETKKTGLIKIRELNL